MDFSGAVLEALREIPKAEVRLGSVSDLLETTKLIRQVHEILERELPDESIGPISMGPYLRSNYFGVLESILISARLSEGRTESESRLEIMGDLHPLMKEFSVHKFMNNLEILLLESFLRLEKTPGTIGPDDRSYIENDVPELIRQLGFAARRYDIIEPLEDILTQTSGKCEVCPEVDVCKGFPGRAASLAMFLLLETLVDGVPEGLSEDVKGFWRWVDQIHRPVS